MALALCAWVYYVLPIWGVLAFFSGAWEKTCCAALGIVGVGKVTARDWSAEGAGRSEGERRHLVLAVFPLVSEHRSE